MGGSQILVTGLPGGTTKHDVIIYFQSERDSGGGDVKKVSEIEQGQAVVTFRNAEDAASVSKKEHCIKGVPVKVYHLPADLGGKEEQSEENGNRSYHNAASNNCPENEMKGASFSASPQPYARETSKFHRDNSSSYEQCTVILPDLPPEVDEETLKLYFENVKRSKGGPVSDVKIDHERRTGFITFKSRADAMRTVEHSPHRVGESIHLNNLSLMKMSGNDPPSASGETTSLDSAVDEIEVIITVSACGSLLPEEEELRDYFENHKRSGGGKVLSIEYNDEGEAVITFAEPVKDLKRLLRPDSHFVNNVPLTVVKQPPKKKIPFDPVRLHVQGFKEGVVIKRDHIQNYLEKFCDVFVTDVRFGSNNLNALVVFDAEPDFKELFDQVSKDPNGLRGSKLQLERVPLCNCIHVNVLEKETDETTLFMMQLYFDNDKNTGGSSVRLVERIGENEALVYFEDSTSVENVLKKGKLHTLGNLKLEVRPNYPFLENTAVNTAEITCDSDLIDYIKNHYEPELRVLLEDNKIKLHMHTESSVTTVSSTAKKNVSYNSWQEKMGHLKNFLQRFMKCAVEIPSEIFDKVTSRWNEQIGPLQGSCNVEVSFDNDRQIAYIIGENNEVERQRICLQRLLCDIKEDADLMKSITEVNIGEIPKSRLTLLKMSGICEELESKHGELLKISFQDNGRRLCLKGPRMLLQEVRPEVLAFTSKVIEQTVPLKTNTTKILRQTAAEYTQNLLKQRGIQALFVYDQDKTSNQIVVVGDCPKSVEEAAVVLQNAVLERSLHFTKENAVVLKSLSWSSFQSELMSNFKAGVFTEFSSNTVCVSGIAEDVKECYERVKQFLETNTILNRSINSDEGITRFIVQKWGSKLEEVKTDLATFFVEIEPLPNYGGFGISGNSEGLEKCVPRLQQLVKAVKNDSIAVEKPAMKKFILHGKGREVLKSVEDSNQCVILVKEGKDCEVPGSGDEIKKFGGLSSLKFVPSNSSKKGTGALIDTPQKDVFAFADTSKSNVPGLESGESTSSSVKKAKTSRSSRGIRITVKNSDLSKEQADILVGTAGPTLNLDQNACAKALKTAAGPSLQKECTRKGPVQTSDIAVINQVGSLKCHTVIFAICSSWNGGQGKEVLKSLLTKCLEEAENNQMKSIAFAAIGTGNLQFPANEVADIYFEELDSFKQKHPETSLEDVRFVLHDTSVFQAFKDAERRKQSRQANLFGNERSVDGVSTFSPLRERGSDHLETTLGSLCFQAQPGNITQETTDAIAIISDTKLDISSSKSGAAILEEGGNTISAECSKNASQPEGSIFVSNAGSLKARHLFHIVPKQVPLTPDSLQSDLLKCLQQAELKGVSSISFPVIGTGQLGMSAECSTQAMLSAVLELSKQKPTSLKLVRLIIFEQSMIKDVRSVMSKVCEERTAEEGGRVRKLIGKGLKKVVNTVTFGFMGKDEEKETALTTNRELDNKTVDLVIFAGCENDLQKARCKVSEILEQTCTQYEVKRKAIKNLNEDDMRQIQFLKLRYVVDIQVKKDQEDFLISVDALPDDIPQVLKGLYEILDGVDQRRHAEMISKDIKWMYSNKKEEFKEYNSDLNAEIEFAYQGKSPSIVFTRDEEKFEISFGSMTEQDEYGDVTAEVRRLDLRKDVEIPVHWLSQRVDPNTGQEETVSIYQLDPSKDAHEYNKVNERFRQSCSNKVVKIERIQNPTLFRTYAINKQRMEKASNGGTIEKCLFHGTKGSNCEKINHSGFNRSFCGQNAALYGNGVYFAFRASYSAQGKYSPPDSNKNRYMYLARVLVGEYTTGSEGVIVPPAKSASNVTDTYDTVVDDVSNPSIYVVFYDWQCYPEYLITFK